ncbi:MAG: acyltransferase family protein, partial [Burkholderiaceae bacterium]
RTDIQALRGLAVLLVLFDHAKIGPFEAGYLGVDVFFVISGYLITGMVRDGLADGTFGFASFYFRRAKRLLPAAYVTFAVTAAIAPFVLTVTENWEFRRQLAGAVTFTGNVVLWMQTGYFEGAAELKPLLHVWSLSIEEQYYLLLPASMALVPRRFWRAGAAAILAGSLALCLAVLPFEPSAAFYLLPTRTWELAVGSVAALGMFEGTKARAVVERLFVPGLIALALLPCVPLGLPHPGAAAMIVCAATLVVVLRKHPACEASLACRGLAFFGDFSYSLYLVHWPIFAFLNCAYVGEPARLPRVVAMVLAILVALVLYRTVELPVRRSSVRISWRSVAAIVSGSCALIAVPVLAAKGRAPDTSYEAVRRINYGFDEACEFTSDEFVPSLKCANSTRPEVLVWGDSYAMHLVPGIVSVTGTGIVQATRSYCGPLARIFHRPA